VDVDADADDGVSDIPGFGFGFDEDAADFARADEQIVGPAEVDCEAGGRLDGGGGEAGGEWQAAAGGRREGWAQKNADVEALAGGGVPGVVAAAAAGQLLVGKKTEPWGARRGRLRGRRCWWSR
jgi:hypothetical protein